MYTKAFLKPVPEMSVEKSNDMEKDCDADDEYALMSCADEVMNNRSPEVMALGIAITSQLRRDEPFGLNVNVTIFPETETEEILGCPTGTTERAAE